MTHVFIVNEQTFNVHLQYMFAGTGDGSNEPQLNTQAAKKYEKENTLTEMIADISKVRLDDEVIFYVTGCKKFFGTFKIASLPFFNQKQNDYLGDKLGKYLPFRVKIKPYQVYAEGVGEHEALDNIEGLLHPYDMCWSLIYRKLTGNRGCSFITDFESKRLIDLIEKSNNSQCLKTKGFYYDPDDRQIKGTSITKTYNRKSNGSLNIDIRLLNVKGSYEGHLQAYITQNFDKKLKELLLPQDYVSLWIGNEVVCSVGEQRIDILIISETSNEIIIRIIELKDEHPKASVIEEQLPWYIEWVDQYIASNYKALNKPIKIIPTVIATWYKKKCDNRTNFIKALNTFNNKPQVKNGTILDMEFIQYIFEKSSINFKKEIVE